MERSASEASVPVEVRIRETPWQGVLPVLLMLAVTAGSHIVFWIEDGTYPVRLVGLVVLWIAVLGLGVLMAFYFGVTLTSSAVVVHNLRRRTIPWSDVQAIRVESILDTRTVVIHEAGGRRTRLRAPTTGFLAWDRGFEEKFHVIGRWWLDHRRQP